MSLKGKNSLLNDGLASKATTNKVKQIESDIADALVELYQLLNKYAPVWYERQHQRKADAVLRRLGRL
jgi:hypothetical protein